MRRFIRPIFCCLLFTSCDRVDRTLEIFCSFFKSVRYADISSHPILQEDTLCTFGDAANAVVRVTYSAGLVERTACYYSDSCGRTARIPSPQAEGRQWICRLQSNGYLALSDWSLHISDAGLIRLYCPGFLLVLGVLFLAFFGIIVLLID